MNINDIANKSCDEAGGQANLARALRISPSAIQQWRTGLRPIPIQHCAAIEKATKGAVTRQALRPDDYWLIWPDLTAPKRIKPTQAA